MEDKYQKSERPERRETKERSYQRKERTDIIFGVHSVLEAIHAGRELNKILIQKGINKTLFEELRAALAGKNYFLQYVPNQKLDSLTDGNHQGVIAMVPPIAYQSIEPLIDQWLEEGKKPSVLVLDRITDVRNFGAIIRSAECMGIDAVLIPFCPSYLRCHESFCRCSQPHSNLQNRTTQAIFVLFATIGLAHRGLYRKSTCASARNQPTR